MKNRLFAVVGLCILVLNLGGSTFADTRAKKNKKIRVNQLVALLPASDGVVTLDVKRFFGDALPKILSANQPVLSEILRKIDEIKAKTGIDIRQFEYVAAGVTAKQLKPKEFDFEPVIIARGQINARALIAAGKLAANGKYREERVGDRTIYIFDAKEIAAKHKPQNQTGKASRIADKFAGRLSQEIAVTAFDANTLVFGTLSLVRQTLQAGTHVGTELTSLLNRKEVAIVNFAAKIPAGMSAFLPLENDELGKNIDAIKYVFGNMDVIGENTFFNVTAKTTENAQAQGLLETLEGLQIVGKAFLGGSKSADKQVYARMIDNAKFSMKGNEVMLDLEIPQGDIDILVGMIK